MLKRWLYGVVAYLILGVVGVAASVGAAPPAATLTVTTTADDTLPNLQCSLREAIINANNDAATHSDCAAGSGADTIVFAAGLAAGTVTLAAELPSITDDVTLDGSALSTPLTLSGNDVVRILHISVGVNVTLDSLTLTRGYAAGVSPGLGGAIRNQGNLTLYDAWLDDNYAPPILGYASGGAIYNQPGASLTLDGVTLSNNTAGNVGGPPGDGGGVYNESGATLLVMDTFFDGNVGTHAGGGIYNNGLLTVADSLFENNATYCAACDDFGIAFGGGVGIYNNGTATVERTTFRYNSGTLYSYGGAFRNELNGVFILRDSVAHDNSISSDYGGGVYNRGEMEITNSTLSANVNGGSGFFGYGGGIYNDSLADGLSLNNVTLANNQAGHGGGVASFGPITLRNTIIADNSATDSGPDCEGTLTSAGYNLVGNTSSCTLVGNLTGVITGQPADLGPLQANGGPTLTHALLNTSIAIDAGNPAGCVDGNNVILTTDQRGFPRPLGLACDLGAYESSESSALVDLSLTKHVQVAYAQEGDEVVYTLTYTNDGPNVATGVQITDVVPLTLTNVAYTFSGAAISLLPGTQYAWEVEDLSPGEGGTITITGEVAPAVYLPSLMPNQAEIVGQENDSTPEDNSAQADVALCAPAMSVSSAADDGAGSLRRAVRLACPGGLVWLEPGLTGSTIYLTTGEIPVDKKLKVNGSLAPGAVVHGSDAGRIFVVEAHADLALRRLTLSHGAGDYGGAIRNAGRLGMAHVTLRDNIASYGGAVYNEPGAHAFVLSSRAFYNTAGAEGGAFYNSAGAVFEMVDVTLSDNSAASGGGGAFNRGEMSVTNSVVMRNQLTDSAGVSAGGGIGNIAGVLWVSGTLVQENDGDSGGGGGIDSYGFIYPEQTYVTIEDSQIISNTAEYGGGGVGMYGGNMTIRRSFIAGNTSPGGGGGVGALFGALTVENSTFSANAAGSGAGLFSTLGTAHLYNVTVADNATLTTGDGGGVSGSVVLYNSLVAGNRVGTNAFDLNADCGGSVSSAGYNLVGLGTGCPTSGTGDQVVVPDEVFATVIGPLTPAVGSTWVHPLLPDSPALDAANPAGCVDGDGGLLTTDQRGLARPVGPACDIGAYEVQ